MMRLSDDNIERIVRSLERHIPEKRNYCLALAAVPNIEAILGLNEKTDAFTGQLPGSGIAKKDLRQKLRAKKKSLVAIKQEIGYIPDHFSEDPQPDMPQHRYWLGLAIATAELTDSDPRDKKVLRDILGKIDDGKRTRRDKVALEHTISRLLREWSKVTGKTPTIWNTEHSDSTCVGSNTREYLDDCLIGIGLGFTSCEHQIEKCIRSIKNARRILQNYDRARGLNHT